LCADGAVVSVAVRREAVGREVQSNGADRNGKSGARSAARRPHHPYICAARGRGSLRRGGRGGHGAVRRVERPGISAV
jgi:hypothetical protein